MKFLLGSLKCKRKSLDVSSRSLGDKYDIDCLNNNNNTKLNI